MRFAALVLLGACEVTRIPDAPVTRAIVVSDQQVSGAPAADVCVRVCPPPKADESLGYCHATTIDRTLAEHRAELGDHIDPDAGPSPVVCTYARKAP